MKLIVGCKYALNKQLINDLPKQTTGFHEKWAHQHHHSFYVNSLCTNPVLCCFCILNCLHCSHEHSPHST